MSEWQESAVDERLREAQVTAKVTAQVTAKVTAQVSAKLVAQSRRSSAVVPVLRGIVNDW